MLLQLLFEEGQAGCQLVHVRAHLQPHARHTAGGQLALQPMPLLLRVSLCKAVGRQQLRIIRRSLRVASSAPPLGKNGLKQQWMGTGGRWPLCCRRCRACKTLIISIRKLRQRACPLCLAAHRHSAQLLPLAASGDEQHGRGPSAGRQLFEEGLKLCECLVCAACILHACSQAAGAQQHTDGRARTCCFSE